jgi:tetratricopeptide (TPR) repeat protein
MQLAYFRGLGVMVFSAAVLAAFATKTSAADSARQPAAALMPSGTALMPSAAVDGPEDAATKAKDAVKPAAEATEKPKTGAPTPAKRRPGDVVTPPASPNPLPTNLRSVPGEGTLIEAVPADEPTGEPKPKSPPVAEQPKANTADEALRPIPASPEGEPVAIEAASFKGVTPGVSTKEDVRKAWGQPKDSTQQNGSPMELYSVQPFDRVEASYANDKVASVIIRLGHSFPAEGAAKQLDLARVRPVLVSNELGEILGLSYPERGVLFAFEPSTTPGKPSMKVAQIILEPIAAEPFVLRAETMLESRPELSQRDLEQALTLERGNARAHWLYSRVLAKAEKYEKAVAAAGEAVRLEPGNARYRATRAQILGQAGRLTEALREAQKAAETAQKRPHVKARALCLQGDLLASGPTPDYKKAMALHTQAIQLADPLASDPHPAIRVAAKEVLIDAHLGAAHDIAWGNWKEKEKAVPRWLQRAAAVADDLIKNEGAGEEQRFRVQARTLAASVGLRGGLNPEAAAKAVVRSGDALIAATPDPARKAQYQWDLGMAMYDAVQICQMRSEPDEALKYGEAAADYLQKAVTLMEQAVKQGALDRSSLAVSYDNLAALHRQLGATEKADRYQEMAARIKSEKLK